MNNLQAKSPTEYDEKLADEAEKILKVQEDTADILKMASRLPFKKQGFYDFISEGRVPPERRPLLERVLKSGKYKRFDHSNRWTRVINDFATSMVEFARDGRVHVTLASVVSAPVPLVASTDWFEHLTKAQQDAYIKEHPNSKYAQGSFKSSEDSHAGKQQAIEDLDRERIALKYQNNDTFARLHHAKLTRDYLNGKPGVKTQDALDEIARHDEAIKRYSKHPAVTRVEKIDAERHARQQAIDLAEALHSKDNKRLKKLINQRFKAELKWTTAETSGMRTQGRDEFRRLNREIAREIDNAH